MGNIYDKAKARREARQAVSNTEPRILGSINRTFATEDGKRTLRWIAEQCHWFTTTTAINPQTGEIMDSLTSYFAQRQDFYRELRALIDVEVLKDIEFRKEEEPTKEE